MVLLDTNVLVYAHAAESPFHDTARRLRDQALDGQLDACLSPQILCEFFATCTNPRLFHPPLTSKEASRELLAYWSETRLKKILPRESTIDRLAALADRHRLRGQQIFDGLLVATMLDNSVRTIYTLNTKDFEIYTELHVINPFSTTAKS